MRNLDLRDRAGGVFWLLPAAIVLAVGVLALGLLQVDRALQRDAGIVLAFTGGPSSARDVLAVVSSSMITFTGLVFSITVVVLVLASNQYSPRVLRTFLRDRLTQVALGLFIATFVYALLALRAVRGTDSSPPDQTFVPGVTVGVAVLLVLVAVAVFVRYIGHIVQLVRLEHIVERIAVETRQAIARVHPPDRPADPAPPPAGPAARTLAAPHPGIVTDVDVDRLVRRASAGDVVVALAVGVGRFVPEGAPLLRLHGPGAATAEVGALCDTVSLRNERTPRGDVAFGFRQLVDIAERALSPGVNDPTTAAQAVDQIHDLLRRLVGNPLAGGVHRDDAGRPRVFVPMPGWADYLAAGVDEVRHWGAGSLQVRRRLRELLEDLLTVAPADRAGAIRDQLRRLDAGEEPDPPTA